MKIIYSTGYLGDHTLSPQARKFATFQAMVLRRNLIVCDIRLNPWSVAPCWRRAAMETALGPNRYCWIPELGNENYRNPGTGISIRHLHKGIDETLRIGRQSGRTPLILCACANLCTCHRFPVGIGFMETRKVDDVIDIDIWDGDLSANPTRPFQASIRRKYSAFIEGGLLLTNEGDNA